MSVYIFAVMYPPIDLLLFHQLVETLKVGVGEVDAYGVQARGEAAVGIPEYVMIKVRLPLTTGNASNLRCLSQWNT